MKKLAGKVAIVSGSGRGIGRACALKLAAEGARVVVNDLDAAPATETVDAIRAAGGEAIAVVGSVTDSDFAARFVGAAIDTWNGLDIIVNNAGYTWDAVIQKMSDEQFDAILDVHLKAPFRILREAIGFIREAAKREAEAGQEIFRKVVNVSSISGTNGNPGQTNYSTAKAGVTGMTRTLAKEWGRYKVNVNAVAFGYIVTRMTQATGPGGATVDIGGRTLPAGVPAQQVRMMEAGIPLGRGGTPEEAANAIYLLCTPEADYVSGQVLMVTGGL
ncbi:MAG: SDR family oxidoreductase [Burkholderiales bacterium]|nr:SDR family oxidoreductase [Burkholderiales bacterium]